MNITGSFADKTAGLATMSKNCIMEVIPEWMTVPHSTGTSIMACEFDEGVIIGADSRTTTGVYIANRMTDKLTRITDHIYCCRSGSAADTQAICDIAKYHLNFYKIEMGEPPSVKTASAIFKELCYNYRNSLCAGVLVAGWDKKGGGQIYSVPLGGMVQRQAVSIGGSGSSYVYGYVDANFKPRMSKSEAMEFVTNTLALAMFRDDSSGGVVRLGAITKDGVERSIILGDKLPKFYEVDCWASPMLDDRFCASRIQRYLRPSQGCYSTVSGACPRCVSRYAIATRELFGPIGHQFYEQCALL